MEHINKKKSTMDYLHKIVCAAIENSDPLLSISSCHASICCENHIDLGFVDKGFVKDGMFGDGRREKLADVVGLVNFGRDYSDLRLLSLENGVHSYFIQNDSVRVSLKIHDIPPLLGSFSVFVTPVGDNGRLCRYARLKINNLTYLSDL